MSNEAQKKFEQTRDQLASALRNLEEIINKKIKDTQINGEMLGSANQDESSLKSQIVEQKNIILNLTDEINKLQKNSAELGKENDFLREKNSFFADKIFKFKTQGSQFIQAAEDDVNRIREIIKNQ